MWGGGPSIITQKNMLVRRKLQPHPSHHLIDFAGPIFVLYFSFCLRISGGSKVDNVVERSELTKSGQFRSSDCPVASPFLPIPITKPSLPFNFISYLHHHPPKLPLQFQQIRTREPLCFSASHQIIYYYYHHGITMSLKASNSSENAMLLPVSDPSPPPSRKDQTPDDKLFKGSAMTKRGASAAISYMSCAGKS